MLLRRASSWPRCRARAAFRQKATRSVIAGSTPVTEQPTPDATISLPRWLAHSDAVARRVVDAGPALRDAALLDYLKTRKSHGEVIHRFFGVPGLTVARTHYDTPAHHGGRNSPARAADRPRIRFGAEPAGAGRTRSACSRSARVRLLHGASRPVRAALIDRDDPGSGLFDRPPSAPGRHH
jgi:hypothetical protein